MQLTGREARKPQTRHLFVQHYKRLTLQTLKEHEGRCLTTEQIRLATLRLRDAAPIYAPSKFYGQAERAISTGKLRALQRFYLRPIKHMVYVCPS